MSQAEPKRPGPPDAKRLAELEAMFRRSNVERAEELERVRRRAGLSVDELAKEMGFSGASSIQRYLSPSYDRGFRPEIARAFRKAFLGRGNPPITDDELLFILRSKIIEPGDPVWETHQRVARLTDHRRALQPNESEGRMVTRLPLTEGEAVVDVPRFLSAKSAAALKTWLGHLAEFAEDSARLREGPNHYGPNDGSHGKNWGK